MRKLVRLLVTMILAVALFCGFAGTANAAWDDNDLAREEMKTLLNAQELHPQRTGYLEFDSLIADILAPYQNSDTYTKLYALYDWTVRNIDYSWEGYSQQWAPCYDKFTLNYLPELTYEEGLPKSAPDEVVNRSYHALKYGKGICYDWAALMALMARYVGIDAYVHTGYFYFEAGGYGHHGWCVIPLNGTNYIFDPQRDYRWTGNGTNTNLELIYFGIPMNGTSDSHYFNLDTAVNAARDAQFLPVASARTRTYLVSASAGGTGSGTVSGGGRYAPGASVTLTASPGAGSVFSGWYDAAGNLVSSDAAYTFTAGESDAGYSASFTATVQIAAVASRSGTVSGTGSFVPGETVTLTGSAAVAGWYDASGNLLSSDSAYTFTVSGAATVYAVFAGDYFLDIPAGAWYAGDVSTAAQRGISKGTSTLYFEPETTYTRAMVVEMLSRIENADTASALASSFTDVDQSQWYADAVNWAAANKIVEGRDAATFDPDGLISRQEFVTIVGRYLENYKGIKLTAASTSFSDAGSIAAYARQWVGKAVNIGLVKGYTDNTFGPEKASTRAEGTTIMVRLDDYLAA